MKTIFTNGCFDILHRGHVELLKFCSTHGKVVVGLNSDKSIKSIKGKSRPLNNQADRELLLRSIKYVDDVVIFNEDTPITLIKTIKPDIIVKGGDYSIDDVIGNDICEVIIFNYIDGYSTTKIIQNIGDR
jgi:D-beta-D-heptose 7-phosphate kinase/D-beta-D-heptose 1-phosphate adenosyltransferase